MLPVSELSGFFASGLVLATFLMRDMRALRVVAIASNVAFIAYALVNALIPILCLHAILLPLNCIRLLELAPRRVPVFVHSSDLPLVRAKGRRTGNRSRTPSGEIGSPDV
jgi:hypothetical protein